MDTAPYLQFLNNKTKLTKSPLVKAMKERVMLDAMKHAERLVKDFCFKIAVSDVTNLNVARFWGDLDDRWPVLAEKFGSRVETVDETFLGAVRDSEEALFGAVDCLADKTFCGTIFILPRGISLSYWFSYDDFGELKEDSVLFMLDETGRILTYLSPVVEFVCREVMVKAAEHVCCVKHNKHPLDAMFGPLEMKDLVRDYLLYCHLASVKAELVPRCGSQDEAKLAGDPDAMVNGYPFDIWRLTGDGPFAFPEAASGENDIDND